MSSENIGHAFKKEMLQGLSNVKELAIRISNDDNYTEKIRFFMREIKFDISQMQQKLRNKNVVNFNRNEMIKYRRKDPNNLDLGK